MNRWRSAGEAFGALDRVLGGQRRPTRIQKWAARHPIGAGLCPAVPFTVLLLVLSPAGGPGAPSSVAMGLFMAVVFALSALSERLRQRRLKRLGLWDGF